MSLVAELAARAHSVGSRPVPPAIRAAARAHLTDAVGALIAGHTTLAGVARTVSAGYGDTRRTAFLGGVYAHGWETGDIHRGSVLCPGCVVLPATLAVLPANASSDGYERAFLAGYEVALAAAAAIGGERLIRRGWWPTALLAPLGGAAAASVLLGRPPAVTASAIALAAQHAGGSIAGATDQADGKYLLAGFAAERAVTAFLAADSGWTGPLDILDDPRSPLRRSEGRSEGALPEAFLLPETSLKPHAGAKHLQGAIDAVLSLRPPEGWPRSSVRRLRCLLPAQLAGIVDRPPPFGSALSALGSAQFVLAVSALRGHCTPWDFDDGALSDEAVLELARVVEVRSADDLTAAYPAKWGARVEVATASGAVSADRLDARGDPGNPLPDHEIVGKFTTLAARELGPVRAREVAESLLGPDPSTVPVLREHVLPLLGGSFGRSPENAAAGVRTGGSS